MRELNPLAAIATAPLSLTLTAALLAASFDVALSATGRPKEEKAGACDYLAASPDDPRRLADGLELDRIEGELAITACSAALDLNTGSARLAYQLARAYESEERFSTALEWYGNAAAQDYAVAKYDLGMLLLRLGENTADHWAALEWLKSAAKQGLPVAQHSYGAIHLRGTRFLKPYPAEAREWLEAAVASGRHEAEFDLATMDDFGLGGKSDKARAGVLYERAAARGNRVALVRLARLYLDGEGLRHDPERGWAILLRMVNRTGGEAEYVMANCYLIGQHVAEDRDRGYELLIAAANAGSAPAENQLLTMYSLYSLLFDSPALEIPGPHGPAEAIAWMEERANKGSWRAAEILWQIYENGRGVPADGGAAARWKAVYRKLKPVR